MYAYKLDVPLSSELRALEQSSAQGSRLKVNVYFSNEMIISITTRTHIRQPAGKNKRSQLHSGNKSIFPYKVASLPTLVTPAKVPDMAAQLQGMFRTPWGFISAKMLFLTVGSRRNGHPQI
jgi:hypothetical protein